MKLKAFVSLHSSANGALLDTTPGNGKRSHHGSSRRGGEGGALFSVVCVREKTNFCYPKANKEKPTSCGLGWEGGLLEPPWMMRINPALAMTFTVWGTAGRWRFHNV